MKTVSTSLLVAASLLLLLVFTPACSSDLAVPADSGSIDLNVNPRTDFSGREAQVRVKVAERDNIQESEILTCYYDSETPEGYGRYKFTTSIPTNGIYTVTGIIGDDIEGW